jgi:type II secretory pathway predicted ATPase ExeA
MRIAADQQSSIRGRGDVAPMSPKAGDAMLAEDLPIHEDAFQQTADSRFCYLDPLRRHASGRLLSGLYEGDGLFLLTGRAGIGKTILVRHLSEQLKALDGVLPLCPMQVFACRTGTMLADVFGACESRLGLGQSAAAPLKATKKLQQLVESNRSPVLLLDDADLLTDDVLEALVTLTGLQAADRRLLSVVLAGHPRVAMRVAAVTGNGEGPASDRAAELEPMAEPDVARLIRHRLRAAGRAEETFGADAIARIVRHSAGVPLAVVRTCRRALQIAESRSRETVTAEIVAEAIGEEGPDVQRDPARPAAAPVATPATQVAPAESSPPRPASPASAVPGVPFYAPAKPRPVSPSPAEPRPASALAPEAWPPGLESSTATPRPSLRREPHTSIPEVTVGHHALSAPRQGASHSPPAAGREEAWWSSNTVDAAPREPLAFFNQVERRRRRGRRVAFAVAGSVLFLVLSAAALVVFMGGPQELGERAGTLSTAGVGSGLGTPPAYDARAASGAWWRPGMPSDSIAPGAAVDKDAGKTETAEQKLLPGLTSLDVGRLGNPVASPSARTTGENGPSHGVDAAAPPAAPPAPSVPESMSRGEAAPAPSPVDAKAVPRPELPAPPANGEPQWKPPAPPEKAEAQPKPAAPVTKPAPPAAKPSTPQTKPAAIASKAVAPRSREIETLLAEGDAWLEEGDLAAARSAYEQAYDRGSSAAAARMAETFDPRNVAATRKTASPAEAILWYQDAARKGDRRARAELDDLASWLENSAASGNHEARRVLDLWREPAAPAAEEPTQ